MRTVLYEDITTNELKTLSELKQEYERSIGCGTSTEDDAFGVVIFENLVENGGNIKIVEDEILNWCNDYSKYMDSERYYSDTEIDENVKGYYESICCNGEYVDEIRKTIGGDVEGLELLIRLNALV